MRGKRERLFECEYGSKLGTSRTVVRAWTPVEAAQTLEEALARAGLLMPGEIVVRDRTGDVLLQLRVPAAARPDAGLSGVA
jgi:hypothetical protein